MEGREKRWNGGDSGRERREEREGGRERERDEIAVWEGVNPQGATI